MSKEFTSVAPHPPTGKDVKNSESEKLKRVSVAELASHKKDNWIALHGKVYDVTAFHQVHPGGPMITEGLGTDATETFASMHTEEHLQKQPLAEHMVGVLVTEGTKEEEPKIMDIEDLAKPEEAMKIFSTPAEPTMALIKALARDGLQGHHGELGAMGVPITELPSWNDLQFLTAQMATKPLLDDAEVETRVVIGPNAKKPLVLSLPVFVSDASFGSLSREAKIALATGAELAGTGICSGEGGMLPAEQEHNSKYFYEVASAKFGFDFSLLKKVQAVHLKGGQGAKCGTGGHLSAVKVTEEIAQVRKLKPGEAAISPSTFQGMTTVADFQAFMSKVREATQGAPIGFKLAAEHIEEDIQFAVDCGADYVIVDGRGGGTGAAPLIFRDNISHPTLAAIPRARQYLDAIHRSDVTLIATGGIRTPADICKALCLGADCVGIVNAAIMSIGCVAAKICHTNRCPVGIATQDSTLRAKLNVDKASKQLYNFLHATQSLIKVMARALGHTSVHAFNLNDLTSWKRDIAMLCGVRYGGIGRIPTEAELAAKAKAQAQKAKATEAILKQLKK